jgi:hypothetical protein
MSSLDKKPTTRNKTPGGKGETTEPRKRSPSLAEFKALQEQVAALQAGVTLPTYSTFVRICAEHPEHEAAVKIAKYTHYKPGAGKQSGGAWKGVVKSVLDALRDLWPEVKKE